MHTYWLIGRAGFTDPLPDYATELSADDPPPILLPPTSGKVVLRPSVESGFAEDEDCSPRSSGSMTSLVCDKLASSRTLMTPVNT